jgi:nucleotide-binding universal stress UspA family protein
MDTILVPLDGSATSECVLPYARLLAAQLGARLRLLRVFSAEDVARALTHGGALAHELGEDRPLRHQSADQLAALLRQRAADKLAARAEELRAAGLEVETELRDGLPAAQIVEVAARGPVRLIAMATHGYSGLQRWALGSVASKVAHAADGSMIFLVRASEQPPKPAWAVKRILVPLDGSELAEQALPPAIELARANQAELILLHVVVPMADDAPGLAPLARLVPPAFAFPDAQREHAHQQLAAAIDRLPTRDLRITPVVVFGLPADQIVDEAARHHADLIVMASHGYSGLRRWALGSVADQVMHGSAAPLLLVRARRPAHA